MAQVQTLGGPIDTDQLGTVLMHEHIFNITWDVQKCWPGFNTWDAEREIPKAQQTLKDLKDAGYDTIVELSVCGLGRDINLWRTVAIKGARSWPSTTLASPSSRPPPDDLGSVERIAGQIDPQ